MFINCYEPSVSSAKITVLWINVVVNLYNLVIIWCNNDSATEVLLGDAAETKQCIIIIETILTLCIIMHSSIPSSILVFSIKFWVLGITLVFLSVDLILASTRSVDLLSRRSLDEFWRIKTDQRVLAAPRNLYLIVAAISIIYFVFKLYVSFTIILIGKEQLYEVANDVYLLNDENLERNSSRDQSLSSTPPPSYDQSITMESSFASTSPPPPPYSEIQKY